MIKSETLQGLVDYQKGDYDAVALSAIFENADGYGRIVRNTSGILSALLNTVMRQTRKG